MAETEFLTGRFPDGEVLRTQARAEMRARLRGFIPEGSRARLREAGGTFGPWRAERELVPRVMARVDAMGVGPKLIVQRESDEAQLSIREVAADPEIPELYADPAIEEAHGHIYDEFGADALRSGGLWLCRYVDGTRTVSKHGYLNPEAGWRGAAEDLFVTSGGMTKLRAVARFTVDRAKSGVLTLATVIVDRSIFTAAGGWAEKPYGGNWHGHQHYDSPGGRPCQP